MTVDRKRKKRVRAHQKATGLGYMAAMADLETQEELAALKRAGERIETMFGFKKKKSAPESLSDEEMSKLDFIVVVDHSGSMNARSIVTNGTRLDEVRDDVMRIAEVAEKHDDDGITVIAFDNKVDVYDGVGSMKVADNFKKFPPRGTTDLTAALTAAVKKANESKKEVVVIVYTDGSPNNRASAEGVIADAGRTLGRPRIGFTFIQVGNDPGSAAFLKRLDDDMPVDVTATLRADEAQGLTLHQLAWLARND